MKLKDTVTMMTSTDKHENLKAEYLQAKIRFQEAVKQTKKMPMTAEKRAGDSPARTMHLRRRALGEYMRSLEKLAKVEGIDLKSLK